MRRQGKMALAALAIASVALPASSAAAQSREAADAAEALAPADGSTEGVQPTWDAVVQAIIGELPPDSTTPPKEGERAQPPAAVDPTGEPSDEAVDLVEWVNATGDNDGLPFIVIDKHAAMLYLFDTEGELLGQTPALLGIANGDESVPGIGDRELSGISVEERTTPAGRFLARYGAATGGRNVLWVDYSTSLALHAVVTANQRERRLQRLRSLTPDDNRITYGCINVPAPFYRNLVQPQFREAGGVVYILPDTRSLEEVFPGLHNSVVLAPGDGPEITS